MILFSGLVYGKALSHGEFVVKIVYDGVWRDYSAEHDSDIACNTERKSPFRKCELYISPVSPKIDSTAQEPHVQLIALLSATSTESSTLLELDGGPIQLIASECTLSEYLKLTLCVL